MWFLLNCRVDIVMIYSKSVFKIMIVLSIVFFMGIVGASTTDEEWEGAFSNIETKFASNILSNDPLIVLVPDFIEQHVARDLKELTQKKLRRLANTRSKWCFTGIDFKKRADDIVGTENWGHLTASQHGSGGNTMCTSKRLLIEAFEASDAFSAGTSLTLLEHRESVLNSVDEILEKELNLNNAHSSPSQLLFYNRGDDYKSHVDCFPGNDPVNQRVISILIYLNDVQIGGETTFPALNISVRPRSGSMLLWSSLDRDTISRCMKSTTHLSKPIIRGEKFAFQKWYHKRPNTALSDLANLDLLRSLGDATLLQPIRDRTVLCEDEVRSCREFSTILFPQKEEEEQREL